MTCVDLGVQQCTEEGHVPSAKATAKILQHFKALQLSRLGDKFWQQAG